MAFIRSVADRVTVLRGGEIMASGTVAEIESNSRGVGGLRRPGGRRPVMNTPLANGPDAARLPGAKAMRSADSRRATTGPRWCAVSTCRSRPARWSRHCWAATVSARPRWCPPCRARCVPSTGVVSLAGRDVTGWPGSRRRGRGLRVVAQDRPVLGELTVAENLRLAGIRDLEEPAKLFPFLRGRERQRAGTLSGGEQKMLAIARTIAAPGTVCVFDEPTEGLQPANVARFADAVRHIAAAGAGVLLAEQHLDMALDVADRWYLMEKGQIAEEGQVREGIVEHDEPDRRPGRGRRPTPGGTEEITSTRTHALARCLRVPEGRGSGSDRPKPPRTTWFSVPSTTRPGGPSWPCWRRNTEPTAGDIAAAFPAIGRTAVSAHLRTLRDARLVSEVRDGKHRRYRLGPNRADAAMRSCARSMSSRCPRTGGGIGTVGGAA